jgi:hypothetical protein
MPRRSNRWCINIGKTSSRPQLGKELVSISPWENSDDQMKLNLKFCVAAAMVCGCLSVLAQGTIHFSLSDNFISRSPLFGAGTNFYLSGNLTNATSETGEPSIEDVSSGQTEWATWTAPSNGIVTLSVQANSFSPLLTVYAGAAPIYTGYFPSSMPTPPSAFTNLSLVASNTYLACYEHTNCGCHWRERNEITFHVQSGQAYQICVDSAIITDASWVLNTQNFGWSWLVVQTTNVVAGGDFQLGLQFTPAPKNDDFVNRIKLSGSRVVTKVSNSGATKQVGETNHLGNSGGSSVWFSWVAPASGRVTLSTNELAAYAPPASSGGFYGVDTSSGALIFTLYEPTCGNLIDQNPPPIFYPVFAAYTGTAVNSLTPANNLPAALDAFPNMVEFDAVKGQTYQIAFDGNLGTTGTIPFYLALTQPAANNNFENRIQLHGIYAAATSYNAGATHQPGEPVFGNSSGKTVWWTWLAPVSGTTSIDLGGSDYAFPVAVFTGLTPARLQMVGGDFGGVSFEAVAGTTYQIAVSDAAGLTGKIKLKVQSPLVELALLRVQPFQNIFRLFYAATPGQVILFQRSNDQLNWQTLQTQTATQRSLQFLVPAAPAANGPYYRAVVVDRKF